MRRLAFAIAFLAAAWAIWQPVPAGAAALGPSEIEAARTAFAAAKSSKWTKADAAADKISNPLLAKTYHWYKLAAPNSDVTFHEIARFIDDEPHWPLGATLLRRAEEAMTPATPAQEVINWFSEHDPITADGGARLVTALVKRGAMDKARPVIRDTWINGNFGARQERQFYRAFSAHLTREDHIARLDRLLWSGQYYSVRRMYRRVSQDYRALAHARMSLRQRKPGVDNAISKVPPALRNDPGLIYERLRWRRKKGRDLDAREMIAKAPENLVRPDLWWQERAILARRAIQMGHISEAYDLARNHGMSGGLGLVEGEWLAGWIALRFLEEPEVGYGHFTTVYRSSNYAISRARGAYWAGRAAEAAGAAQRARFWYRTAAEYPMTFYGQLAAARYNHDGNLRIPPEPFPDSVEAEGFARHELVRVVRLLDEAGLNEFMPPFIRQLNDLGQTPGWRAQVAALASLHGRSDLAVRAAKQAIREGVHILGDGFPTLDVVIRDDIETSLVHAVIRQESAFNQEAISHAGARGLMQIMPRTARGIARQLEVPYRRAALTGDAAYNLNLGQAYLKDMITEFDGSYVMALAAYNAGPSRVKSWVREFGDPSDPAVDPVDWIELIPFDETRNYVQRVLENLHVYRVRLTDRQLALNPENDLRR